MTPTATRASEFTEKQLGLIRKKFYPARFDKEFFQDKNRLLQAIAAPAEHLQVRYGVKAIDSVYAKALQTVIQAVGDKGMSRAKIDRFSVYFLHCVQAHLTHHGEDYYEEAKAGIRASEQLPEVMRQLRRGEMNQTAAVLIELARTLKSRAGRKRKPAPAAQASLF